MRMIALSLIAGMSAFLVGCARRSEATSSSADDQALAQGTWIVSKMEVADGHAPPPEVLGDLEVTIKGDRITVMSLGKKSAVFHAKFTNNGTKNPKELDLVETDEKGVSEENLLPRGKGDTMAAIYKFEGDQLMIAAPPKPGEPRPSQFEATPRNTNREGGVAVLILKRK